MKRSPDALANPNGTPEDDMTSLSSSKAPSEALWNRFGSDLELILGPFWEPKSIIKASAMTFDGVYTQSQFLNDIIGVLNDFGFGLGFEIAPKLI